MPLIVEVLAAFAAWVLICVSDVALCIARSTNRVATRLLLWMERKDGDAD